MRTLNLGGGGEWGKRGKCEEGDHSLTLAATVGTEENGPGADHSLTLAATGADNYFSRRIN